MHFGLYAFDLFLEIYREAWAWEQQHGPGSLADDFQEPGQDGTLRPLSETYADEGAFIRDIPRLIIERNIYGVDIDPRAAQIASLALSLRAQRAWRDLGVPAQDRPAVDQATISRLITERISPAVKDALKSLLEAPAPCAGRGRKPAAPRRAAVMRRSPRETAAADGTDSAGGDAVGERRGARSYTSGENNA